MVFIQPVSFVLKHQPWLSGATFGSLLSAQQPHVLSGVASTNVATLVIRGGAVTVSTVDAFRFSLLVSSFLCTTVFGMLYITGGALMPGLASLSDAEFLEAFKAVDKRFADFSPILMVVWFGALLANMASTAIGVFGNVLEERKSKWWMVASTVLYLAGFVSTIVFNLPLNAQVQSLDTSKMNANALALERRKFERPWVAANWFRVAVFGMSSAISLVQLLLLK